MEAFKEKTVALLLVIGAAVSVISLIIGFMFVGGGVFHATATRDPITNQVTDMGDSFLSKFGLLGFVAGLLMMGAGIGYGIVKHRNRFVGNVNTIPNVRVIARFGYTRDWNLLSEPWEFEAADNPTYYLKLETRPGLVEEFECKPETYYAAGEGMYGEAVLKGRWCGRFAPYIGVRNEEQPTG